MFYTRLLCLFLLHQTGPTLGQDFFFIFSATIGLDMMIPCSVSVEEIPPDNRIFQILWYFQEKKILHYHHILQTTDPRISIDTDRIKYGIFNLLISSVSLSDGGLYRCSVNHTSVKLEREIKLDIQAPPQIVITNKVIVANKESVLRSSITGFYPVDIAVTWLRDGEILKPVTVDKPQTNPDGTYNVNSSVTITPTEEDRERNFSCRVEHYTLHEGLQEDFQLVFGDTKDISILRSTVVAVCTLVTVGLGIVILALIIYYQRYKKQHFPCPPVMGEIIKLPVANGTEAKLQCRISGYFPGDLDVKWVRREAGKQELYEVSPSDKYKIPVMEITQQSDKTYTCTASLIVTVSALTEHGAEFICRVTHPTLVTPLEKRTGELSVTGFPSPPVMDEVITLSLVYSTEAKLQCRISGYFPGDLDVKWLRREAEKQELYEVSPSDKYKIPEMEITQQSDKTYTCTASLIVSVSVRKEHGSEFICRVKHPTLEAPLEKRTGELSLTDFPSFPVMDEIIIPPLVPGIEAQLLCRISGYYPGDLDVKWMRRRPGKQELYEVSPSNKYKIPVMEIEQESDKTYTCTASLIVSVSARTDHGSEFICRVTHPTLETPLEKRTGELNVPEIWSAKNKR